MMIVRNKKTKWMLGVVVCSLVGCQTTNLSVPLTAQHGKLKSSSANVAASSAPQSISAPSSSTPPSK
ncbi:MAG: hypothetical protein ACK5T6_19245, partial [Pirellula sp.]